MERESRSAWIGQMEREVASEEKFIAEPEMTDAELLAALDAPACVHCGKSKAEHFGEFCHRNYSFIGCTSFTP